MCGPKRLAPAHPCRQCSTWDRGGRLPLAPDMQGFVNAEVRSKARALQTKLAAAEAEVRLRMEAQRKALGRQEVPVPRRAGDRDPDYRDLVRRHYNDLKSKDYPVDLRDVLRQMGATQSFADDEAMVKMFSYLQDPAAVRAAVQMPAGRKGWDGPRDKFSLVHKALPYGALPHLAGAFDPSAEAAGAPPRNYLGVSTIVTSRFALARLPPAPATYDFVPMDIFHDTTSSSPIFKTDASQKLRYRGTAFFQLASDGHLYRFRQTNKYDKTWEMVDTGHFFSAADAEATPLPEGVKGVLGREPEGGPPLVVQNDLYRGGPCVTFQYMDKTTGETQQEVRKNTVVFSPMVLHLYRRFPGGPRDRVLEVGADGVPLPDTKPVAFIRPGAAPGELESEQDAQTAFGTPYLYQRDLGTCIESGMPEKARPCFPLPGVSKPAAIARPPPAPVPAPAYRPSAAVDLRGAGAADIRDRPGVRPLNPKVKESLAGVKFYVVQEDGRVARVDSSGNFLSLVSPLRLKNPTRSGFRPGSALDFLVLENDSEVYLEQPFIYEQLFYDAGPMTYVNDEFPPTRVMKNTYVFDRVATRV